MPFALFIHITMVTIAGEFLFPCIPMVNERYELSETEMALAISIKIHRYNLWHGPYDVWAIYATVSISMLYAVWCVQYIINIH